MSASLVGSEMCIRDSQLRLPLPKTRSPATVNTTNTPAQAMSNLRRPDMSALNQDRLGFGPEIKPSRLAQRSPRNSIPETPVAVEPTRRRRADQGGTQAASLES
eukprot:15348119-Alexandrium_andersonii.AAC.1